MCSTSCSRRSAASSEPSSSNCWWACASASSRSTTLAPMVWRIFRSSAWAQVAPKSPVEAPMTDGFVKQDVGGDRPGDPVEGVLERAGDRRVVLRGGEQDGVGPGDLMAHHAQRGDVIAAGAGFVVFIEGWYRLDHGRVELDELDTGRQCCGGGAQQLGVERAGPSGTGDRQDMQGRRRGRGCGDVGVSRHGRGALLGKLGGLRLLDEVDVVRDAAGLACAYGDEDAVVEPRQFWGGGLDAERGAKR